MYVADQMVINHFQMLTVPKENASILNLQIPTTKHSIS